MHFNLRMNFNRAEAATSKWLESHEDFQLVFADESESRLQFTCSRPQFSSFFIVCPTSDDRNWVRVYRLPYRIRLHSFDLKSGFVFVLNKRGLM